MNGDVTPYAAQNQNNSGKYTYPVGTPTYTINNQTGVGAVGSVKDNATVNNNYTGRLEVSPALGKAIGVTQQTPSGRFKNSTNNASITTYYYP